MKYEIGDVAWHVNWKSVVKIMYVINEEYHPYKVKVVTGRRVNGTSNTRDEYLTSLPKLISILFGCKNPNGEV